MLTSIAQAGDIADNDVLQQEQAIVRPASPDSPSDTKDVDRVAHSIRDWISLTNDHSPIPCDEATMIYPIT